MVILNNNGGIGIEDNMVGKIVLDRKPITSGFYNDRVKLNVQEFYRPRHNFEKVADFIIPNNYKLLGINYDTNEIEVLDQNDNYFKKLNYNGEVVQTGNLYSAPPTEEYALANKLDPSVSIRKITTTINSNTYYDNGYFYVLTEYIDYSTSDGYINSKHSEQFLYKYKCFGTESVTKYNFYNIFFRHVTDFIIVNDYYIHAFAESDTYKRIVVATLLNNEQVQTNSNKVYAYDGGDLNCYIKGKNKKSLYALYFEEDPGDFKFIYSNTNNIREQILDKSMDFSNDFDLSRKMVLNDCSSDGAAKNNVNTAIILYSIYNTYGDDLTEATMIKSNVTVSNFCFIVSSGGEIGMKTIYQLYKPSHQNIKITNILYDPFHDSNELIIFDEDGFQSYYKMPEPGQLRLFNEPYKIEKLSSLPLFDYYDSAKDDRSLVFYNETTKQLQIFNRPNNLFYVVLQDNENKLEIIS